MNRSLLLFACVFALAGSARGGIIDFTDAAFSFVDGQQTATITAGGYELTLTAELLPGIPEWALPHITPSLSHETGSGLGVNTTVLALFNIFDPEIEWFERLKITANSSLQLLGFTLSNVYEEGWLHPYKEKALYSVNGGVWQTVAGNSGGSIKVMFDDPSAPGFSLEFKTGAPQGLFKYSDFQVANLHVASVPEPGTFALLGGVLVVVGVYGRRLRLGRSRQP
jgi:hypothetical protein